MQVLELGDDPARPQLPPVNIEYWDVILNPICLESVSKLLQQDHYVCPAEVLEDVRLVFCNAMRFNDESSEMYHYAAALFFVAGNLWR